MSARRKNLAEENKRDDTTLNYYQKLLKPKLNYIQYTHNYVLYNYEILRCKKCFLSTKCYYSNVKMLLNFKTLYFEFIKHERRIKHHKCSI